MMAHHSECSVENELSNLEQVFCSFVLLQVLANCLTLMMQVQGVKKLVSNKALMYSLINRIKVREGSPGMVQLQ